MSGDPFAHGMPAGHFHTWVSPPSEECPHCECCSKRLCEIAIAKDTACHWEGARNSPYDLSECPCWRAGSAARAALDPSAVGGEPKATPEKASDPGGGS